MRKTFINSVGNLVVRTGQGVTVPVTAGSSLATASNVVTDWVSFSPTGSWITNTTYTGQWRRVGDSMEIRVGLVVSGAPTAAQLRINMPTGYLIDLAKLPNSGNYEAVGIANSVDMTGSAWDIGQARVVTANNYVEVLYDPGDGTAQYVDATHPFVWAATDKCYVHIIVPIVGWSSAGSGSALRRTQSVLSAGFSTNSGTYVDTGLSCTFQTVANEDIMLMFSGISQLLDVSPGSTAFYAYSLDGGTEITLCTNSGNIQYGANNISVAQMITIPTAGIHTIKIRMHTDTGTNHNLAWNPATVPTLQIVQYAGADPVIENKPQMTYVSASSYSFNSLNGATMLMLLSDNKRYRGIGPLAVDFSNGVNDLGLDTGVEALSTWYYFYAVPKSGDASQFSIRMSANAPDVGPAGYTVWKYLGAAYNDSSSNWIPTTQVGNHFYFRIRQIDYFDGGGGAFATTLFTMTYAPKTAIAAYLNGYIAGSGSYSQIQYYHEDETNDANVYQYVQRADPDFSTRDIVFYIPLKSTIAAKKLKAKGVQIGGTIGSWGFYPLGWIDGWVDAAPTVTSSLPNVIGGGYQNALIFTASGGLNTTSTTPVDVPGMVDQIINVPSDGTYTIMLTPNVYSSFNGGGDPAFNGDVLIDGITSVIFPDVLLVAKGGANTNVSATLIATVSLTAGSHTIRPRLAIVGGLSTMSVSASYDWEIYVMSPGNNAYVNRGDVAAFDFSTGSFTKDGNWHLLDLSAIVPPEAAGKEIHIRVDVTATANGQFFLMSSDFSTLNAINCSSFLPYAGINYVTEFKVTCGADRKIYYNFIGGGVWTKFDMAIRGYRR